MVEGNCSEIYIKEKNILWASEIYFPWGHGARRFVSMAPVFLSAVLILAKKTLKVDSYRCCSTRRFIMDVYFNCDLTQHKFNASAFIQ